MSTGMEKWSNEKTLNFINAIHQRPELWDVESSAYRDRNIKKDSWLAVADEHGITPDEAYKKFRSLRTYAKCEEKKLQRKSGMTGGSPSTWFAYDAMSFILSQDVPDAGVDNENTSGEILFKTELILEDESEMEPEIHAMPLRYIQPVQKKAPHRDRLQEAHDKAVRVSHRDARKRTHSSAAFGEHVANKLIRYSDSIRSEVEFKISKLLYEADLRMFQSGRGQSTSAFCPASPEAAFSDGSV